MIDVQTEARPLNQWERVADTFVAPSLTFEDIRRSASWWLPFVLVCLSALAVSFSIDRKVGFAQVVENQIQQSPSQQEQLNGLDPPTRAARLEAMAKGYRYTSYAYPVVVLLISLLAAVVLWATFNFGLGTRATFGQMLALWMYASLPRILLSLIIVATLWFGGSPESFDLRQPAGTNPGYYLTEAAPWVRTLLSFFDVIGIWTLVLLILGGAIVARTSTGKAAAAVLTWWVLILVGSVAATAAFS